MTDSELYSTLWAVHGEDEEACPVLVTWARSKAEAEERIADIQRNVGADAARMKFWVARMTNAEVEDFKEFGALPGDA